MLAGIADCGEWGLCADEAGIGQLHALGHGFVVGYTPPRLPPPHGVTAVERGCLPVMHLLKPENTVSLLSEIVSEAQGSTM